MNDAIPEIIARMISKNANPKPANSISGGLSDSKIEGSFILLKITEKINIKYPIKQKIGINVIMPIPIFCDLDKFIIKILKLLSYLC